MSELDKRTEHSLQVSGVEVVPLGLRIDRDSVSAQDWLDMGPVLVGRYNQDRWMLADYLLAGEHSYSDVFSQACDITGLSPHSLGIYIRTAKAFPHHRRRPNLSFSHHQEASCCEEGIQEILLDMADDQGLPARALRDLRNEFIDADESEAESAQAPDRNDVGPNAQYSPPKKSDMMDKAEYDAQEQEEPGESTDHVSNDWPTDGAGEPIPEKLSELWSRRGELITMTRELASMRKKLRAMVQDKDPLMGHVAWHELEADLNNARRGIGHTTPYAVCPHCHGNGCRQCSETGWLSKYAYEHLTVKPGGDV
jgi:hypothetical protein